MGGVPIFLTSLDVLYIVLSLFISILGTLGAIVLIRLIKVLGMATEIVDYYNQVKRVLAAYAEVPQRIKEKISETLSREKKKERKNAS